MMRNMTNNPTEWPQGPQQAPLMRPYHRRILAGVAAGIADYLEIDVAVVRIGFVVLCLLGGFGIPAYLAGWLLIPEEGAPVSVAESWLDHYRQRAA
jgi:phage shock protein PspC (stress-responsive transcriptional regulator)